MKKIISVQKTLIQGAANSPYGWLAAKHMEDEKGIFDEDDKGNMKKLREAEGCVRRDRKEYNARRRDSQPYNKRGGWNGKANTRWGPPVNKTGLQAALGSAPVTGQNYGPAAAFQAGATRVGRGGKALTCFNCGDTSHLVATCPSLKKN